MINLKRKYAEYKVKEKKERYSTVETRWEGKEEAGNGRVCHQNILFRSCLWQAECNQANNLSFIKHCFNSLLFRQKIHILVGDKVQAVNWMGGMLRVWVMAVKDLNLLKDV